MKQHPGLQPADFELSGPALLRKYYFPRQRLHLSELPPVLGICRDRIYKRLKSGTLGLIVRTDEAGRPFVNIEDLIVYLYPPTACHPEAPEAKPRRGPGRPRKSTNLGGAV